ncbi:unnamed protein product [Rhizoctonia solani]|uniref:XPG-I domain-containing protein n=1 Tax=Rhizoctonia solani TaxID=456999 RepID=A0A8H3BIF9_9AGAM|nr:unnamed protein product [Rhizoctonia solani]
MGVPGLWDIIRHTGKSEALAQLALEGFRRDLAVNPIQGLPPDTPHPRALRIGIDASIWFFHAAYGREGENPELRTLFFRLARLAKYTFCPLFVFDGPQRPRNKRGKTVNTRMNSLAPGMKNMISAFGFEWRTAPGEAEAELAYLNNIGVIDAILSDDVDNFLFGARVVIRNPSGTLTGNRGYPALNRDGKDDGVHVMVYRMEDIEKDPACKLTRGGMILIGLLSGGDYDQGAKRCGPKTALALAQRGLGDELLNAFETFSREKFIDYIPAWKDAVVEALRSGCATLEADEADVEDLEEESQETAITASQNSATGGNKGKGKATNKSKKKKPPAKRQPALAAALAASDFPDLSVLEDYCAPWTSERAFSAGARALGPSSSSLDPDDVPPASQGSVITCSQTSTKSTSRSKKKAALTANSVGAGGLTSDVRIGWTGELALGALGRICEQYFEWGVREIIQQRFRTVLWPAVVLRVLRRSVMEQEHARRLSRSRDITPRPSTPTKAKTTRIVPGTPRKFVNRHFGGGSDSESDRELPTALVRSRGGDATPKAKRRISMEGEELDTHQLLQAVRGERQHVSTDGLPEFRVEVAPGHLARLAVRELLGTRDPALLAGTLFDLEGAAGKEADEEQEEGDDEESVKRLKIVDPSTSIRVWVPAELVRMVHPDLVQVWETRGTKTKARSKAGGSTSRQKSKEDVGTGKRVTSAARSKTKDKTALKEKPRNLPTTLSGDEVEEPDPQANPTARLPKLNRIRSASPGMSRRPPVARSGAPPSKGPRSNFALNTIPERSSSPTILPERSPPPVVTRPPPSRPTKTRSTPTPLVTATPKGSTSRRPAIPGVEHVPTPPRCGKFDNVGNESSELEDVNFKELLSRPKKHSVPESDSESEKDPGGPIKYSRRNRAHTSPHNSSGSEIEIVKLSPKQGKTRKSSVANSARPTTRSQSNSSGSGFEILDSSYLLSHPAKNKTPPLDDAAEHMATAPRQIRRTSHEHTSPRASSASEGEDHKPHVLPRRPTAKRLARTVSDLARSNGKLIMKDSGSKGARSPTPADISEGIIDISSDDGGSLLLRTVSASKSMAGSAASTRPDKTVVSRAGSRSSSSTLDVSDTSIIDLISD